MNGYTLYGGGVTRSAVIEALLRELDQDYALVAVDPLKGEHRTPDYLALNPAGFVPTLVTPEGDVLHETVAMIIYLADRYPNAGLAPAPGETGRGRFLSRLLYLNNDIDSRTKSLFYAHRWSTDGADAPRIRDKAFEALVERWRVYDDWLAADGPFALGERFSAADVFMALWAAYGLRELDDVTGRYAHVGACYDAVIARPKAGPPIAAVRDALARWKAVGGRDAEVSQ
jgi:glutathione S-transferase